MLISAVLDVVTIGSAVPLLEIVMNPEAPSASWVVYAATGFLTFLGLQSDSNTLALSFLVFASVLFSLYSGFVLLQTYAVAVAGQRLHNETKNALFNRFLHAPFEDLSARGRGAILYAIEGPSNAITSAIGYLGVVVSAGLNVAMMLAMMVYLSWWATLLIGVVGLCVMYGARSYMDNRARVCGNTIYDLKTDQTRIATDVFDGIRVVKVHGLERKAARRMELLLTAEMSPMLRLTLFRALPSFINEFTAGVVVILLGGLTFLAPAVGMPFPTLVAFLLAVRRCSPSVSNISSALIYLSSLRKDMEVIDEVLHSTPSEKYEGQCPSRIADIRLNNLSFAYPSRREINALNNVDVFMERATVTAIVGHTGSGKSTIVSLLAGLYRPNSGNILVNGVDLSELNLENWRSKLGYVSQDVFLFNGNIRDNIASWDDKITQPEIEWAARRAQLHDFVLSLPDGYDTLVGDRGLRLSGGQAQRVAIARAILRKPDVLLFDEATSALDNVTERAVYEAISAMRKDAIVIVVAHRLSTIRDADQVIVLDAGRIVETGTHDSLVACRGVYSRLYETDAITSDAAEMNR